MYDAITYEEMIYIIGNNRQKIGGNCDTIGILFTRPELKVGKDIVNSLNYYHHRSGENINFFLPGYCAYCATEYPDERMVSKINGVSWYYSDSMFVKFIEELEARLNWEYSEESELMLVELTEKGINYNQCMDIYIEKMFVDKKVNSVMSFLGKLFSYSKKTTGGYSEFVDKAKQVVDVISISEGLSMSGFEEGKYWRFL